MIRRLITYARCALARYVAPADALPPAPQHSAASPVVALRVATQPVAAVPHAISTARRGRPVSATLVRTQELLVKRPAISAAELATALKVSPSYARTLLRRAKARTAEPVPPSAISAIAAVAPSHRAEPAVNTTILNRLEAAEREIRDLHSARVPTRSRWDLSRRAEVIRRGVAGESAAEIAANLQMPQGEVRFILKVHKVLLQES
jgi:DNA-binding CsgD family transcriptional regulator